jgi:hypothetical protein
MQLPGPLLNFIWCVLFPLWLLAGVGDYLCHRRTRIELNSGRYESMLHLAEALQLALPLLAVLFLRINALVLAVVMATMVVHTATAYWDLHYTTGKRFIPAIEQVVHAVLLLVPLFSAALLAMMYWTEFLTLLGLERTPDAWAVQLKPDPVRPAYLGLILGCTFVLNFLPLLEEVFRTSRTRAVVPAATLA